MGVFSQALTKLVAKYTENFFTTKSAFVQQLVAKSPK